MLRNITKDDLPHISLMYPNQHPQFWQLMLEDYKEHCFIAKNQDNKYDGFILATDKWILQFELTSNLTSIALMSLCLNSYNNQKQGDLKIKITKQNITMRNFVSSLGFEKVEEEDIYRFLF